MSTRVSVIIVHYNSEKETKECLHSLFELVTNSELAADSKFVTKHTILSVVVVDNGSKELFKIPPHAPKDTHLIRSDANLGFSSGNNLGIEYAIKQQQPDFILLLNSDTLVAPDSLEKMVEYASAHPDIGALSPKIYFAKGYEYHAGSYSRTQKGNVLWYAGGSVDWLNLLAFHHGVDEVDYGHFDQVQESDFATGCCMLIPRQVLERVGYFDKKYFLYFEDVDLSLRIARAGYKVVYYPAAHIWHKNAGSSGGSGSEIHQYYQTRNRLYFSFLYGTNRVRFTAAKFTLRLLFQGTAIERRAALDFCLGKMGKQRFL